MSYRRLAVSLTVLAVTAFASASSAWAQQRSAEVALEEAMHVEQVEGDLQRAITLYQRILTDRSSNRTVAAKAQLHIGICYETLGLQEAQQAYQRVMADYGDQPDAVSQARMRLAALRATAPPNRGPSAKRVLTSAATADALPEAEPSPDGSRLAYVSTSDGGVYVRDVTSGEVRQVASGLPAIWNYFPVWAPDGRRLAFSTEDREAGIMTVNIVDLSSNQVIVVPETRVKGWIDVEDWSSDGRQLLCNTGGDQLALIAVEDGRRKVLTDSAFLGNGALSPDGRFVAYAVGGEHDAQVVIQSIETGTARRTTSTPGGNSRPKWAPDGRSIAYQSGAGIWVIAVAADAPGGPARLAVSASRLLLRRWLATGLYYSQFVDAGQRSMPYQVPMDPKTGRPGDGGVQVVPSAHPDSVTAFAWSPDMRQLVFGHRLSPEITVASASSGSEVTWDLGRQGHPLRTLRWSGDGSAIQYEAEMWFWRAEGSTVLELDPATGRVRELFPRTHGAAGFSLSTDGRSMAFYRLATAGSDAAAAWPSGGSLIRAVVVAGVGESDGQVVATAGDPGEVPFSSTVPPSLSSQGDRVLFVRQAQIEDTRAATPAAASLWVVDSDGHGARQLATAAFIQSAIWDPAARFIAFTAKPDIADGATVLRVVDVATGEQMDVTLPDHISQARGTSAYVRLTNWSSDGSLLGRVAGKDFDSAWEYWVVEGLVEGGS